MVLFGKQPVRIAGVVTLPFWITGATQVFVGFNGSRSTPSSAVPTTPSGPRNLNEKSPLRSARVGIVRKVEPVKRRMYFHSIPAKKKNLSRMIGPPRLQPKLLYRNAGRSTSGLRVLLKKLLASSLSFRMYSNRLPVYLFWPLRVTTLIAAPELRPYSAEKFDVLMLTSRMKSMPTLLI